MTIHIACPSCRTVDELDDGMQGKKVLCRTCQKPMLIPGALRPESTADDLWTRDEKLAASPPRSSAALARCDEGDAPWGRPAGRSRDRGRVEEPGRSRRLDRSSREPARGHALLLILGGGVGLVGLVFIAFVVGGLVSVFNGQGSPSPTAASSPEQALAPEGNAVVPEAAPEVAIPAGPVPTEIAPNVVQQVKQATAYLRVNLPGGGVAEGSGFFALERGIVVTNAHVLGMLRASSLAPNKVEVVIRSGEPGETKMAGVVLGVDRNNDLAVLRVAGDVSRLPPPLPVDTATKLTETQKVYIFGFPFGADLGKNITVSSSAITSMRRGDNGVLKQIQVNGGMHPGNSGGPVTDARGVVVGVCVAGIPGTQINFAIPADFVKQVVASKIVKAEMGFAYRNGKETRLSVTLSFLDPMNRIRQVKVDIWTGPAGAALPASSTLQAARMGDSPRKRFTIPGKDGRYVGDVVLPSAPAGHRVWLQPMMVNASGASQWYASLAVPVETRTPIDVAPPAPGPIVKNEPDKPPPVLPPDPTKGDAIKFSGDVFSFVQAAVKEKRLIDVDIRGAQFNNRYRDVPEEGALLIGFQFGLGKWGNNATIKSWQPIFLTSKGEKFGQWQGKAPKTPITVKARTGYVVSGMAVRTGIELDAVTLTFAKLGKDRLDLTDTYQSKPIGGSGGWPSMIGGKGALLIGVTGRLGGNMFPCSLGVVAALPKE